MYKEAYKEDIEKFIVFINDLATDLFYDQLMCDGEVMFQCGACYEFVKIIKKYFDIQNILVNKEYNHCAFEYNGNYYDSKGIIDNRENFSIATEIDMLYIIERFGGNLSGYHIYENMINELSKIEEIPHLPQKFYSKKRMKNV